MKFFEDLLVISITTILIIIAVVLIIATIETFIDRFRIRQVIKIRKNNDNYIRELIKNGATDEDLDEINKRLLELAQKQMQEIQEFKERELDRFKK